VEDDYYVAVINWFRRRHHWRIHREEILYTTGVVPAMSVAIKALTMPGEKVLILSPDYNCFFSSIRNNGCTAEECPLAVGDDGRYGIDFDALEKSASVPGVKVLLLCNPHNPGGNVWSEEELARIGEICSRRGILVVSDEIHGEFVFGAARYTPFARVNDLNRRISVTCTSASKSFNIAGLQMAAIITDDEALRSRIDRAINVNEVCDVNPFGYAAAIAAYSEQGEAWLEALLAYIGENDRTVREFFARRLPGFRVMPLAGTYLEWVDVKSLGLASESVEAELTSVEKVRIAAGVHYGAAGEGFIRINIACPRARLLEGLARIERGLKRLAGRRENE
jgi:cystathionine beta-lyase